MEKSGLQYAPLGDVRSVVLAFLALWSIVSLIIIVVWATSPELKTNQTSQMSQCRAELLTSHQNLQEMKENHHRDRLALETMVLETRENLSRVEEHRSILEHLLEATNNTLDTCNMDNVILRGNISLLEDQIQSHIQTEKNLTAQNSELQDEIEILQQNVTELTLHTQACHSLKVAAESSMMAARIQNTACNSSKLLLNKQLLRCKDLVAEQRHQMTSSTSDSQTAVEPDEASNPDPNTGTNLEVLSLILLPCCILHLVI